jgi:multiple sugar transport system ATP-binding protein
MSAVDYQNIGKKYGSVTVMEDVTFSIEECKFVVLLGPSGCGKTTLLRMTAGLEKVTRGNILFSGQRINNVHPRDRDIAMVFQSYALYPQMTVYDNIAFSLQVRKESKQVISQRVQEAAEILDLTAFMDRYPKALSGGQRQRVAMGRALVRHPKVFLFDEPLSNLDAKLRAQMRYEIRRIHDRLNTTTVYVTHDQIEAMTMADEIVVMRDGAVEQMGTPETIYDRPVNCFVADFIGSPSINFMQGTIDTKHGAPIVRINDQSLSLPTGIAVTDGQKVTLGIRPLDIDIDSDINCDINGDINGDGALQSEVEFVENTGAESHLHLKFAGNVIRAVSQRRLQRQRGETQGFRIEPAKVHVFDRETRQRIS